MTIVDITESVAPALQAGIHWSNPVVPTFKIKELQLQKIQLFFYVTVWCQDLTKTGQIPIVLKLFSMQSTEGKRSV